MKVSDLFQLRYGQSLELNALVQVSRPKGVNFVGRALRNNGVTARVLVDENIPLGQPGVLTVALSGNGGRLATFLQPEPFVCGYHVMILTPKDTAMSEEERLWWAVCIYENRYRYSFGRQANRTLADLELPNEFPERFRRKTLPRFDELLAPLCSPISLQPTQEWKPFPLGSLFDIRKGTRITKRDQVPGNVPFLTASEKNNGVTAYISKPPDFPGGSISVPYNGSIGKAFYQPTPFNAGDDVQVLIPKEPVPELALLFVCTVIRVEAVRYSYGRKWNMERMGKDSIRLPADADGRPDWAHMARYMAGLKLSRIATEAVGQQLQAEPNVGLGTTVESNDSAQLSLFSTAD